MRADGYVGDVARDTNSPDRFFEALTVGGSVQIGISRASGLGRRLGVFGCRAGDPGRSRGEALREASPLEVSSSLAKGQVSVIAVMVSKMLPDIWARWRGLELVPGAGGTVVNTAGGGILAVAVLGFAAGALRGRRKNCW